MEEIYVSLRALFSKLGKAAWKGWWSKIPRCVASGQQLDQETT